FFSFCFLPLPHSPLFPYTTLFRSFIQAPISTVGPTILAFSRGAFSALAAATACSAASRIPTSVVFREPTSARVWFPQYPLIEQADRKSTRLNSSHVSISYAVFCLK